MRFVAQHTVDGPPDEQGAKAGKKVPMEGRGVPFGRKHVWAKVREVEIDEVRRSAKKV